MTRASERGKAATYAELHNPFISNRLRGRGRKGFQAIENQPTALGGASARYGDGLMQPMGTECARI